MNVHTSSRAAVAVQPYLTEIRDFTIPEVGPDTGLLRVVATGICGSDWTMYKNKEPGPRILGHEMVGVIEALGEIAADRWGVKQGDLVALEEYLPCGHCEFCRSGEYRSCLETDTQLPGTIRYGSTPVAVAPGLWGGYSQYLYLHPRTVFHKVPAGVPPHIASMALPIGNGFQWIQFDAGGGPGKTVVIQGPGQQGLGCVIAAKTVGCDRIIVTGLGRDESRLKLARDLGADHAVNVEEEAPEDAVRRLTDGRMADIVVEATTAGPEIVNSSLSLLRKHGVLVLATRTGKPVPAFDADKMVKMQIKVLGTRGHGYGSVEIALNMMRSKKFQLELLSSHLIGLADLDDALHMVGGQTKERCIHVTVDPWK